MYAIRSYYDEAYEHAVERASFEQYASQDPAA